MPRHDVDPLAPELGNDSLHPGSLQPHASTHRIDRLVPRVHGDLGPTADLSGDLLDLDDPLLDLRHLELEERGHEERVPSRKDEARTLRGLLDLAEHRADRIALPVTLPWVLILPRNDCLRVSRPVQHDHDLAAFDLLDLSGKQVPHPIGILVPNPLALSFTDPLDDPLLDRLNGVPAELRELDRDLHHVADLEVGILPTSLFQTDLGGRVLDLLDDTAQYDDVEIARYVVNVHLGLNRRTIDPGQSGHDAVPDEVVHLVRRKALCRGYIAESRNDLPGICHHSLPLTSTGRAGGPP